MMFISKFNKLIRNKLLWGGFSFIIAISFVAMFTKTSSRQDEPQNKVGLLDGKAVGADEYKSAYFNSYLTVSLMFGKPMNVTPKVEPALRKMTWRRLAALRAARSMGLSAGDDEVIAAIQQQPFFGENGRFSPERYQGFVNNFLAGMQTSEKQFEEHIRQELVLSKARQILAQAVWIAPQEIEQIFHQLYDTFVISYAALNMDDIAHTVKVSEKEARAYFDENRKRFTIPELVSVKYVAFNVAPYMDENEVDDAAVRSYYDDHIEEFTVKGTDDWENARPLGEVEVEIRAKLAWDAAESQTADLAADFEVALAPDKDGRAPGFEELAHAASLVVSTTKLFSVTDKIPGLAAGTEFNKAAFELRATPDEYFSHPVKGRKTFYILAYNERLDSREPEFEEVRGKVMLAARENIVVTRLEKLGQEIHDAIAADVAKGIAFEKAAQKIGLEVFTSEPFSVKEGFEDISDESGYFYDAVRSALALNSGELTDVIPTRTGIVLAYVESRKTAERTVFESIKHDLGRYIKRKREEMVFGEWQDYLLAAAKFQDLKAVKPARPKPEDENRDDHVTPEEMSL